MTTIFVDNKPYYINEFRDFTDLVRDRISADAEKYLVENIIDKSALISEISDEIKIEENELENNLNDFDEGYIQGLYSAIEIIEQLK